MRALATAVVAAAAALAVLATPAAGAASCGHEVIDAWAAGTLDGSFDPSCYRAALDSLPADVAGYSDAPDQIEDALHSALRRVRSRSLAAVAVSPPSTGRDPAPLLLTAGGGALAAVVVAAAVVTGLRRRR